MERRPAELDWLNQPITLHDTDVNVTPAAITGKFPAVVRWLLNWGRSNSVWPLTMGLACCALEMQAAAMSRFDLARFGSEAFRASPRQADLMIASGTVNEKMAPVLRRLYDQMAEPKYVIAMGACAMNGGPYWRTYNVVQGIHRVIPVDVYVPGCPPRPEALIQALTEVQSQIRTGRRGLITGEFQPSTDDEP